MKREHRRDSSAVEFEREFKGRYYRPKQLDKLVINNGFEKVDYTYYHFISSFLALIAPTLSLFIGEKLEEILYKSKLFGYFGKGYIVKAKCIK